MMEIQAGYYSLGKVGRPNEDRYRLLGGGLILPDNRNSAFKEMDRGQIYAVMDGVGGAKMGGRAAQCIADILSDFYTNPDIPASIEGIENLLIQANQTIASWGLEEGTQRSSGASTVTLAWISPKRELVTFHAGDSAAFLQTEEGFKKITIDHENGGGIFRFAGEGPSFFVDINKQPLQEDDTIVLVTDGVTKRVKEGEMQTILESYAGEPGLIAKKIVELSKNRDVSDDITALVIEVLAW